MAPPPVQPGVPGFFIGEAVKIVKEGAHQGQLGVIVGPREEGKEDVVAQDTYKVKLLTGDHAGRYKEYMDFELEHREAPVPKGRRPTDSDIVPSLVAEDPDVAPEPPPGAYTALGLLDLRMWQEGARAGEDFVLPGDAGPKPVMGTDPGRRRRPSKVEQLEQHFYQLEGGRRSPATATGRSTVSPREERVHFPRSSERKEVKRIANAWIRSAGERARPDPSTLCWADYEMLRPSPFREAERRKKTMNFQMGILRRLDRPSMRFSAWVENEERAAERQRSAQREHMLREHAREQAAHRAAQGLRRDAQHIKARADSINEILGGRRLNSPRSGGG